MASPLPSPTEIAAFFEEDRTFARFECFVETFLLHHVVNWASCAILLQAVTSIEPSKFPAPMDTFRASELWPTAYPARLRDAHPASPVAVPAAFGLSADSSVLFRHLLRVPGNAPSPLRLQSRDTRMLAGILAHVMEDASWNVIRDGGSCCHQCSKAHGAQMMEDCRGLASEHVPEEENLGLPTCTSCYVQGLLCTWPELESE